ncbi:ATP-binding protein [Telmatospirillum sp. J64-1]|uniref:ATP-binding protein n=1 Tax=Telmatospirillum sp. J64-1 TaxID=2502183 RepID=UPI00115EF6F5|nr:ATP-binding protein [Telmatospirillum sp. J64-1]
MNSVSQVRRTAGWNWGVKRLLPRGLLGRSLLILVMPLVVLQLVSTYVFFATHWQHLARRLSQGIAGDVAMVTEMLRRHPAVEEREFLFETARHKMSLDITLHEGAILPNVAPPAQRGFLYKALIRELTGYVGRPIHLDVTSHRREIEIKVQLTNGVLQIIVPRKRLYTDTTYLFVLWMVGTSLLLFGIATIFMRNQVRSVRKLATAADSFGKGRDVTDFKPEGATEVRQAASAFLLMRDRIQRQIAQRTEMLAGVSHDLRTPLTRMKLQLAMMGEGEGIAELQEDVAEMEQMVEGYLAFARGEGREAVSDTDLSALLEDVVSRFRRNGTEIDLRCPEELSLPLRPHAFSRCLGNLIGNAGRYAGRIAVEARQRGNAIEVLVDDDGPGIPEDKREDVFKAFYRLEGSRNPKTGGVGLGLTIARDVVRGHGGELMLETSPLGGLRARIRLPL